MTTEQATLSIPPDSASIAGARRFTESFLREHGLDVLIETMVLLVSEVVTNAIIHGGTGAELSLTVSENSVRAEVRDGSISLPAVKQYSDSATTGRGMMIVESLATAWGTESDAEGKVVWFAIDARSAVAQPSQVDSGISSESLLSGDAGDVEAALGSMTGGDPQQGTQTARALVGA